MKTNEQIPKPCKCGNTLVGTTHEFFFGTTIYHVSCLICGEQGKSADTPEKAIELWNEMVNEQ